MRNNKATRLNRTMMYAIALMGILILVCTYSFVYLSLPNEQAEIDEPAQTDSLTINGAQTGSVLR